MAPIDRRQFLKHGSTAAAVTALHAQSGQAGQSPRPRPNLLFILTDDQRSDAMGCSSDGLVITPNIDSLARHGVRFAHACVTTSICSPSRACCLTGRYASANGVPGLNGRLRPGERPFAQTLKDAGYQTGYVGKWHLRRPATPAAAGFDAATWFRANGPHYDRRVIERGRPHVAQGFLEDYLARQAVAFMESAVRNGAPFLLHVSTQLPHMDPQFRWVPRQQTLARYDEATMPLPASWNDDLSGKPPYLRTGRHRTRARAYGYEHPAAIRRHFRHYFAAITDLDSALGTVLAALDRLRIRDRTWIILMGDNGWFMGEHGFTSKVLAYEESIRVPFVVSGPGVRPAASDALVLNTDIAPTLLELAGAPVPHSLHGRSLLPLLDGQASEWRQSILYEAPRPELGSWPLMAVRTHRWKYIRTFELASPARIAFEELYDLRSDPAEMRNLAGSGEHGATLDGLRAELDRLRRAIQ